MEIVVVFAVAALLATAVDLVLGLRAFAKGSDDAQDLVINNYWMRRRVQLQALTIGIVLLGILLFEIWRF
jgi:hypothetical protein